MKVTLSEIKKNYREPTVERMKLKIKSTIWNTRKEKALITTRKRKNSKKGQSEEPLGHL